MSYGAQEKQALDLVNPVRLYDLRMSPSRSQRDDSYNAIKEPNALLDSIDNDDVSNQITIESVTVRSEKELTAFPA